MSVDFSSSSVFSVFIEVVFEEFSYFISIQFVQQPRNDEVYRLLHRKSVDLCVGTNVCLWVYIVLTL